MCAVFVRLGNLVKNFYGENIYNEIDFFFRKYNEIDSIIKVDGQIWYN